MAADEAIFLFSLFYHVLSLKSSFVSDTFPFAFFYLFPSCCPRCKHAKGMSKGDVACPGSLNDEDALLSLQNPCPNSKQNFPNGCFFQPDFSTRHTRKLTPRFPRSHLDRASSPLATWGLPYGTGAEYSNALEHEFGGLALPGSAQGERKGA